MVYLLFYLYLHIATPLSLILIRKITAVPPPGSNTMVSSLDTLDPITAVQMESLEHQSTSEHYSHDYEVQEPDSDTERLVSGESNNFRCREEELADFSFVRKLFFVFFFSSSPHGWVRFSYTEYTYKADFDACL